VASEGTDAESAQAAAAEIVTTVEPSSIGNTWVTWDPSACSFVPATVTETAWVGDITKEETPWKFGFATQSETLASVLTQMNDKLKAAASEANIELIFGNNDLGGPNQNTAPLSEAQRIAQQEPQVFGSFDITESRLPAVLKPFSDKCIPVVQLEAAAEGTVFVGTDNETAGKAAGDYLADWAIAKGWDPAETLVVGAFQAGLPENLNRRLRACEEAIVAKMPGASVEEFNVGDKFTASTLANFGDFLTANPDAKQMLVCTMADLFATGVAQEAVNANRADQVAVVGHLATDEGKEVIRKGGPMIGSVDIDFSNLGLYTLAVAQDIQDSLPVPDTIYPAVRVIDASNVDAG
jgi:ABC-type sugar transport system substrate-binding protein